MGLSEENLDILGNRNGSRTTTPYRLVLIQSCYKLNIAQTWYSSHTRYSFPFRPKDNLCTGFVSNKQCPWSHPPPFRWIVPHNDETTLFFYTLLFSLGFLMIRKQKSNPVLKRYWLLLMSKCFHVYCKRKLTSSPNG